MPKAQDQASSWDLGFTFAPQVTKPAEGEADGPIRFTGVAYSGGQVPNYGWLGDIAIDLESLKNPAGQVPVLANHDDRLNSIAGHGLLSIQTTPLGERGLQIDGQLSKATDAGNQVAALLAEGFPIQMSVRLSGATLRETEGEISVNGRTVKCEHVFENATVREVSFVPVGADPNTGASAAFSAKQSTPTKPQEGKSMPRSAEDQAEFDALKAQNAALAAQVAEAQKGARVAALSALFSEIGRDMPAEDKRAPYLEMSEAAFSVFSADLRATKASAKPAGRQVDPALFSAQSAGRKAGDAGEKKPSDALFAAVDALIKK
jgi:cell division protein FtsB